MVQRLDPYTDSIKRLGLNLATLKVHARLIHAVMRRQAKPTFKILDTCRLDNGGILTARPTAARPAADWAKGYVAFIPAAGAASRYSQPMYALSEAMEANDDAAAVKGLQALAQEGAASWPLPQHVAELIAAPERYHQLDQAARDELFHDLHLPKALMPCVKEGVSFLAMKHLENAKLAGLSGQLFVTPPGQQATFASHLQAELRQHHAGAGAVPTAYEEQGPALSTIRFQRDGSPFLEPSGEVSPVPAGHGSLVHLFPSVKEQFRSADSVFIRNIDNVMGASPAVLQATAAFLQLHRALLTAIQSVRRCLAGGDVEGAAAAMRRALNETGLSSWVLSQEVASALPSGPAGLLWQVQGALFHARLNEGLQMERLQALYERPFNLMGQVPNTKKDVGGTPCFIVMPTPDEEAGDGPKHGKVCLEVPHASAADKERFLADAAVATHFNPGFCAVEIPASGDYYSSRNHDFWLLAEKTYRGQAVVYYETVLYELLGHSDFANTVFVEVPRSIFNPHKTLRDALNQKLADWLP